MNTTIKTIKDIPNEILIFIFAQLHDHRELEALALVCRSWHVLVTSNVCWREAFLWRWNGLPLLPCTANLRAGLVTTISWRKEYMWHLKLQKLWKAGSLQATSFSLQGVGLNIGVLEYGGNDTLLAGSLDASTITIFNSKTGKQYRDPLSVFGSDNIDQASLSCLETIGGSISCSSGGSGSSSRGMWILAGKFDGSVYIAHTLPSVTEGDSLSPWNSIKTLTRVHGNRVSGFALWDETVHSRRLFVARVSATNRKVEESTSFHQEDRLFFSASFDGRVCLWSTMSVECLASFEGNGSPITCLNYFKGFLIATTAEGDIATWKVPVLKVIELFNNNHGRQDVQLFKKYDCSSTSGNIPINKIWIDSINDLIYIQKETNITCLTFNLDQGISSSSFNHVLPKIPTAIDFLLPTVHLGVGLLVTGDQDGLVTVYQTNRNALKQVFSSDTHESAISALFLSTSLLISATLDGSVHVRDAVNFSLLRKVNHKHRNRPLDAEAEERFRVRNIVSDGQNISISQSSAIVSWSERPRVLKIPNSRHPAKIPISYKGAAASQSSGANRKEVQYEVSSAVRETRLERERLEKERGRVETLNGKVADHGMSEQELLEYAQFLSMQSEEGSGDAGGSGGEGLGLGYMNHNLSEQEELDLSLALSLSLN